MRLAVLSLLTVTIHVAPAVDNGDSAADGSATSAALADPNPESPRVSPTSPPSDAAALPGWAAWLSTPPPSGTSDKVNPQELQPTTSTADRQKKRLLVIRTHRCSSTAFGGWILRAAHASHGRLEAYRAADGEVARTGVTAWAAHANAVLDNRAVGPLPAHGPWTARGQWHTDNDDDNTASGDNDVIAKDSEGGGRSTLIVAFIRSPPSQFASAYGSFKSSGMGYYGESLSDTLSRPPQPENWRLDNMNARSLGWGPLENGAWDMKLTPDQERHGVGLAAEAFIAQVEKEVDLVLIVDHMVESLVILRRALGAEKLTTPFL